MQDKVKKDEWANFNYNGAWLGLTDLYSYDMQNPQMEWYKLESKIFLSQIRTLFSTGNCPIKPLCCELLHFVTDGFT